MTEPQLYELLGRKQAAIEELAANYGNLVAIVRGIKAGTVSLERLTIADDGIWTLAPAIAKDTEDEEAA